MVVLSEKCSLESNLPYSELSDSSICTDDNGISCACWERYEFISTCFDQSTSKENLLSSVGPSQYDMIPLIEVIQISRCLTVYSTSRAIWEIDCDIPTAITNSINPTNSTPCSCGIHNPLEPLHCPLVDICRSNF